MPFPLRYPLAGALLLSGPLLSRAQPSPTAWIRYEQPYVRLAVAQDGLYRIRAAELQRSGFRLPTAPTQLQLFHRGTEQALYVEAGADGRLDADDYVEFYGRRNDGAPDSALYVRPNGRSAQPHPYYSLFSDTSAYFLTWQANVVGKRMPRPTDTSTAGLAPEPYHWAEDRAVFTQTYPAGNIYPMGAGYTNGAILTDYDVGEGWTGPAVKAGTRWTHRFVLSHYVAAAGPPQLTGLLVGRDPADHVVDCYAGPPTTAGRLVDTLFFANYDPHPIVTSLQPADVAPDGHLALTVAPRPGAGEVSVSYWQLRYPQRTDVAGEADRILTLRPVPGGRALLRLTGATADTRVLDVTDPATVRRLTGQLTSNGLTVVVPNAQTSRRLLVTRQPRPVAAIHPVRFRPLDATTLAATRPTFLLVTHPLLRRPVGNVSDPVRAYAAYRASAAGGGYDTLVVSVQELFDQYSYGERHALALRRFAETAARAAGPAKTPFLFLVGLSRDPQGIRQNPNGHLLDLVPNAGWPGSDLGLVMGLNNEPAYVPALPVGRLAATQPQQVLDYLTKVIAHENTSTPALWRKDALHLSGGRSAAELIEFREYVDAFRDVVEQRYVGGRVQTVAKRTDAPVEVIPVADAVNRGLGMISMFGHSGLDVADIDIGFASDDRRGYRNAGRYPFLLANGCASGNFYFGRPTFGTDWLLTPERGAVLFLAHTYNGFAGTLKAYSDELYGLLADSQYVAKPIGVLQRETIRRYLRTNTSIFAITNAQQMVLQGDPAVAPFPLPRPDVGFGSWRVTDARGDSLTARSDSVALTGTLVNYGRVTGSGLAIRLRRYSAAGQLLREGRLTRPAPYYADTLRVVLPNDRAGAGYFELTLDPDNQIPELNEQNNRLTLSTAGGATPLPFPDDRTPPTLEVAFDGQRIRNDDYVAMQPTLTVLLKDDNSRLLRTDTTGLELYLQRPCPTGNCRFERLSLRPATWQPAGPDNAFRLTYRPPTPLPDGLYTLDVAARDLSGNRAAPYGIRFRVRGQAELVSARVYPNPFSSQSRFDVVVTGDVPPDEVSVSLHDATGRLVRTVQLPPRVGLNTWYWDGRADAGHVLPAGVYVYALRIRRAGQDVPTTAEGDVALRGKVVLTR